ncbi:MAG TPA: hypothetical protein VGQ44_17250 [Gemmatimonadaceae bacterium]|jgi:hypothetical protein|nr:hypothetical protein [Gemmatimonadaceae bacterium]
MAKARKGVIPAALRPFVKKKKAGAKSKGGKKRMPASLARKLGKPGLGSTAY